MLARRWAEDTDARVSLIEAGVADAVVGVAHPETGGALPTPRRLHRASRLPGYDAAWMSAGAIRPVNRLSDTDTDVATGGTADVTAGIPTGATPRSRPELPLARYRMRFRSRSPHATPCDPSRLTGYLGSAWRGAFGHALRKAVCVTRLERCDPCVLLRSCPYPFLFESRTSPGAKKLTRYPHIPGPYVLEPPDPRFDTDGEEGGLDLGVILFGPANDHLPYVVHALDQAARHGLTARRVRFELRSVQVESRTSRVGRRGGGDPDVGTDAALGERASRLLDAPPVADSTRPAGVIDADGTGDSRGTGSTSGTGDDWMTIFEPGGPLSPALPEPPPVPAAPRSVRVRLLTPLRLRRHERLVSTSDLTFRAFAGNLLRRLSLLTYFFADTPLDIDFSGLLGRAESIPMIEPRLRWHEWTRHSSRQKAKVPMGGLVGSFVLEGSGLGPFWPSLWLGQWTHVGKGCSMGLGRYVLEPMEALDQVPPAQATATLASSTRIPSLDEWWPAPKRL